MMKKFTQSTVGAFSCFLNIKITLVFLLAFCSSLNLEGQTTVTFPYTGAIQNWTVPAGVTSVTVKIWGAGGAGGDYATGGTGAYVTGTLTVTSGQVLGIVVGQGGQVPTSVTTAYAYGGGGKGGYGSTSVGGGGGGRSSIQISSTDVVTAGGGGGGGGNYNVSSAYPHGGGGATPGWDSSAASATTYAGKAGTTSAGGAAGTTGAGTAPTAGTVLTGGNGGISTYGGGGGGGGYYGGGGGTGYTGYTRIGGGGGGSSYTGYTGFSGTNTAGTKIASGTSGVTSNTAVPGNTDTNYVSGVGVGGDYIPTAGGNGYVTITYTLPACAAPTSLAASATATVTGAGMISGSFTAATTPPYGYVVVRSTSNTLPTLSTGATYTVGSNTALATNGYIEYVGTSAGSWTSTGLLSNTPYYYYVFSYNAVSCSGGPRYSASATTANATTLSCSTFSSVISIGGGTTTAGSLYPILTAAIADLSACGITQATTLSLNSSYNSSAETFPIIVPSISGSNTTNTITVKPASGVTASISGASASNQIIRINGGSNFIIDGSNTVGGTTKNLTITNTSTSSSGVVVIGSPNTTPVTNMTLKNTTVTNGVNTSSAVIVASSSVVGDPGYFNNITIKNNTISKAYVGVFVNGNTAANNGDGLLIDGNLLNSSGANSIRLIGVYVAGVDGNSTISNNTIGNISNANGEAVNGIWLYAGTNKANITGNTISGVASTVSGTYAAMGILLNTGSATSTVNVNNNNISGISSVGITYSDMVSGVYVVGATKNVNIYSNNISNIKNTSTSSYTASGILLGSTSTVANVNVYNNMIWDVAGYGSSTAWRNGFGISAIGGAGYKIYYNSVNMATDQATAGVSAAIYVDSGISTANAFDIRNNIFNNSQTTGTRYAIYSGAANTVYSNINYNDYYSTGSVGYLGSARSALANWQTATGKDTNSLSVVPSFVLATNLHLNACNNALESAGTPIAGITTDIDGQARNTSTPDIGADEIAGIVSPTIASATGGSNCGIGTVNLSAVGAITGSNPAISEYRWYSASTGGSLLATTTTGSWTTPSISTTTNYYVAAYNGCETSARTVVVATINPMPTDITAITETQKSSGTIMSACDVDYVELTSVGGAVTQSLLTDVFASNISNWTTPDNTSAGYWEYSATNTATGAASGEARFNAFSGSATTTTGDFGLKSSVLNTVGFTSLSVSFKHYLSHYSSGYSYTIKVQTSTDGTTWTNRWSATPTANIVATTQTVDLSAVINQPNVYVRLAVSGSIFGLNYWYIDDVNVSGNKQQVTWNTVPPVSTGAVVPGLYTNTALSASYMEGTVATTVYAAPGAATKYLAKATVNTCYKTAETSTIVRARNEYVGMSTDWDTASNWFPNVVPDANKCVNIPAGKTAVIANDVFAKSLTIASTGKLTINANKSLTVIDAINITNNATNDNVVLESDASLMQVNNTSNSGKIYVKRDVKMRKTDYTFWSSPVDSQPLRNTGSSTGGTNPNTYNIGGFSEGTPNNRIYYYDEPTDYFKMTNDANFLPGRGYAIRGKDSYDSSIFTPDSAMKFIGVPNNGNGVSVIIQRSNDAGAIEHGYNLIGNPYPSNLDFIAFYNFDQGGGVHNYDNIKGKAWFWTNTSPTATQSGSGYTGSNYAVLSLAGGAPATGVDVAGTTGSPVPTQYIKVGQGFIVQKRSVTIPPTATLKFDNSMRSNATGVFYNNNKSDLQIDRYWVKLVSPENVSNTILVAHMLKATNDYDVDYDADLLSIGDDSFYSKLNTNKLQIQARNLLNSEDVIPLGSKYSMNGTYKITLGDKEGIFGSAQKIYLHDKMTNTYTNLSEKDYSFNAVKGTDETRFELVYKSKEVLGTAATVKSNFMVYRDGMSYIVASSKKLGKIELFDSSGRLIRTLSASETKTRIDMSDIANGIYVLKVENSGETKTRKIIK